MICRTKDICWSLHRIRVRRYGPLWTILRKVLKSIDNQVSQLTFKPVGNQTCKSSTWQQSLSGFEFLHGILSRLSRDVRKLWERVVIENGCFLFSDCECGIRFRAPIKLIPRWISLQPFPMTPPCKASDRLDGNWEKENYLKIMWVISILLDLSESIFSLRLSEVKMIREDKS